MNPKNIYLALYLHDKSRITRALEQGWDPKTPGPEGQSAIHEAALVGAASLIAPLVAAGADVNGLSEDGYTPLIMAVSSPTVAAKELREEASFEALEEHERVAWSAARGHAQDTISALVQAGANINGADVEGQTPLLLAIQQGAVDTVKTLLELGADPTVRNADKVTALSLAERAKPANPEIVALLSAAQPQQLMLAGIEPEPTASPKRARTGP